MPIEVNCNECGKVILRKPSDIKSKNYCSKECRYPRNNKPCENCGKIFHTKLFGFEKVRFCSRKCLLEGRTKHYEGQRFGYLTAIRKTKNLNRLTYFLLRCDCGNEIERDIHSLIEANSANCGCIRVKRQKSIRKKLSEKGKKICRICNENLALENFRERKSSIDGYRSECILCLSVEARFRWKTNSKTKELIRAEIIQERIETAKRNKFLAYNPDLRWCSEKNHFVDLNLFRKDSKQRLVRKCNDCLEGLRKKYVQSERGKNRLIKYQRTNAEKAKARAAKWYKENRERALKYSSQKRQTTEWKEKQKVYVRLWNKNNPHRVSAAAENRRARKKNAQGKFTVEQWQMKLEYFGHRCYLCGVGNIKLTLDHRIPLSRGGTNWIANIAPACKSCNSSKHDKTEREFRERKKACR